MTKADTQTSPPLLIAANGELADEAKKSRGLSSLKPLAALKPYVFAHPYHVAAALTALVISALAMLSVPMAVRRMIDFGFGAPQAGMIDQYFAMLLVVGGILALSIACRFSVGRIVVRVGVFRARIPDRKSHRTLAS